MHRLVFLIFLLGPSFAYAQGTLEDIHKIQEQKAGLFLEQKRLLQEIASLEGELQDLSQHYETKHEKITTQQKELSKKFLLLARLGRINPLRVLVDPSTNQSTLRGIILLRTLTTSLKHHIQSIKAELTEIEALSKDLNLKAQSHSHLLQEIELQQVHLSSLESQKIQEHVQNELDRLADVADVNALLEETREALSKGKRKSPPPPSGELPFRWLERPVAGNIIENASLQNKFSPHSKGLIFETQKNAEIFAPCDGKVVFKGPFRSQENIILILDHGKKVYTIFMGMHKIGAELGQSVYAGEKLGTMAGYGKTPPKLYFELRQGGKAIDPQPYFSD